MSVSLYLDLTLSLALLKMLFSAYIYDKAKLIYRLIEIQYSVGLFHDCLYQNTL